MGLDVYFYKFDPQGPVSIPYQSWMGDVYTEVDVKQWYDWNLFNYLHPEFNIKDYNWQSYSGSVYDHSLFIGRDIENGFFYHHYKNRKTKEIVVIEDEYIPTITRPYLKTFVREVFYKTRGHGWKQIPAPKDSDIRKIWNSFSKETKKWTSPESCPIIPKEEYVRIIQKPEYAWILNRISGQRGGSKYNGIRALDYDAVEISW